MSKQNIIGVVVLVVIAGVIGFIETSKPEQSNLAAQEIVLNSNERTAEKETLFERAKEITTPDGFINTDAFQLADYIGEKVILVEFWTYSCINCQRVIPYLNAWHTKYEDDGLLVVGIHTPEFEFEKDIVNVQRAVEKFEVPWSVVLDNDYSTWRAYRNQYWPRKYLIDIDGFIVYDHIGEGAYDETEQKIVELLNERNRVLGEDTSVVVKAGEVETDVVDYRKIGTPETYLGSSRIERIANLTNVMCLTETCTYAFTGAQFDGYELDGEWTITPEFSSNIGSASLRIPFTASKVNLVAGTGNGQVRARTLIDGEVISNSASGSEVVNGEVLFTTEDLYNLVDLDGSYETHLLEIQFLDSGVEVFAFTFG